MDSKRIQIPKQILLSIGFSMALSLIRVWWTGSAYFLFLIWNLFLGFLPLLVSLLLLNYTSSRRMSFNLFGGLLVWLLIFPNAPYLMTDIIHLRANSVAPIWYDALLLGSFAWLGILFTIYSLNYVEQILFRVYSKKIVHTIMPLSILITSFGVYIGRFLRWNSWDILLHPVFLLNDIENVLSHPLHQEMMIFVLLFFVFIYGSYLSFRLLLSALKW